MNTNTAEAINTYDELTQTAYEKLQTTFVIRKHYPSEEMLQGLCSLQDTLTKMLNDEAEPAYYLSSLDPGVGKTTAIRTWLEAYLKTSPQHGVLISLERLEEIEDFISEAELLETSYAVLVSDNKPKGRKLNAKGLGPDRRKDALILFTTKAQIRLRTEGKRFSEVASLFYKSEPRKVRIWDESLLVGKPLTISSGQIAKLVDTLNKSGNGELGAAVLRLSIELQEMKEDGKVYLMPELDVSQAKFASYFRSAPTDEREISEVFAAMTGRDVTVRTDNRCGGVLVDCEDSLPEDYAPCLVTDASGRIRETYNLQRKYQGNVIRLAPEGSVKRYDNLEVHVWRRGSGKSYYKKNGTESTAHEVAKVIKSRPDEEFLVIHFKDYNVEKDINLKLDKEDHDRVKYLTLGMHTATNDYRDIPNVIITGMLHYRTADYEADARASACRRTVDGPMEDSEVERMVLAEAAHHVLQATCRGRIRKAIGSQCPESRLWLIDSPRTKVENLLPKLFPGCKGLKWKTDRKPLSGQRQEALKLILEAVVKGEKVIPASRIRKALDMTTGNFTNWVIDNIDFEDALAEYGIEPDKRRNRWYFVASPFEPVTIP